MQGAVSISEGMKAIREWSAVQTKGRDKSHSVQHFQRVENFIKLITDNSQVKCELNSIQSASIEVILL